MALDTIVRCLVGLDMFRGLAPAQIDRIAREADRIIFRDGQTLIEAGAEADGALVIVSGRTKALADPAHGFVARLIEPGSMLGEAAILTEHRFGLTVIAECDVRAIRITRETMLRNIAEDPALAAHFHERLAARLQRVALELRMIDEHLSAAAQVASAESGSASAQAVA